MLECVVLWMGVEDIYRSTVLTSLNIFFREKVIYSLTQDIPEN